MGNIISGDKNVEKNQYDDWQHYAVQGDTLDKIEERLKRFGVTHYKYETLGFGELCYYVAFSPCKSKCIVPESWIPTTAPLRWFIKNGHVYTDMDINMNIITNQK
mgnify:CR=1 FL=1